MKLAFPYTQVQMCQSFPKKELFGNVFFFVFLLVSAKKSSTKKWGKPLDLTGVSLLWQEPHPSPKTWYITSLAWTWKFLNCTVCNRIFSILISLFIVIHLRKLLWVESKFEFKFSVRVPSRGLFRISIFWVLSVNNIFI